MTGQKSLYVSVVVTFLLGAVLSVATYAVMLRLDNQKVRSNFERAAENRFAAFKRELDYDLHIMDSLKAFYVGSYEVTRAEFREFTHLFLSRDRDIRALEWIPRVAGEQRESFERAVRISGFPAFLIREDTAPGKNGRPPRRDEYFPVCYVEPYGGNETALGFDMASDAAQWESLKRARDTEGLAVTLAERSANRTDLLFFEPVYGKGSRTDSVNARRRGLQGFVAGVFSIADIDERSLTFLAPEGIDHYLYDRTEAAGPRLLYYHRGRNGVVTTSSTGRGAPWENKDLEFAKALTIGEKNWVVIYRATPDYLRRNRGWQPWAALAIGLLLTCLTAAYLAGMTRRAAELSETNEKLLLEIKERSNMEQMLSRGKEEWERTFDSATELIALVDKNHKIKRCNRSFAAFFEQPITTIGGRYCFDFLPYRPEEIRSDSGTAQEITRYEVKTSTSQWFYLSFSPLSSERGAVGGDVGDYIVTAADITALKYTQERLIHSEEELKKKVRDLERFYEMAVGREIRMKELKKEVRKLQAELAAVRNNGG